MTEQSEPALEARHLLRQARSASLATQAAGQPFAGLVTPATTAAADLLLLLSDLSEHTRHLRADPRCAVLVVGAAPDANPQTAPRVTLLGPATIDDTPAARGRFLAVHPYAALYAGFGDFHVWRVAVERASFVGGFARAFRLDEAAWRPDPAAVARVAGAAADIMAHCNADHADTMALLAGRPADPPGAVRVVGVDVDGCDLQAGEATTRIAWSRPADDADAIRRDLIRLARAARA